MSAGVWADLIAALIGAVVAAAGSFVSFAILSAKHEERLDGHDREFKGVAEVLGALDTRFVPRNEIDAKLSSLKETTARIENAVNMLTTLVVHRGGVKE